MQINSINNTNFGLKFSTRANNLFNRGRREVELKNSRSLPVWDNFRNEIKNSFDDNCSLILERIKGKDDTLKDTISIKNGRGIVYPIFTLNKGENIDRTYIQIIRDKIVALSGKIKDEDRYGNSYLYKCKF